MKTLDMTVGKPSTLLLKFAFPMMLSMLLQQCYSMCDSLLVGRFLGDLALTATGSAGNFSWITQNLVCCAIYGYGVALSQLFGAKDDDGYQQFPVGALVLMIVDCHLGPLPTQTQCSSGIKPNPQPRGWGFFLHWQDRHSKIKKTLPHRRTHHGYSRTGKKTRHPQGAGRAGLFRRRAAGQRRHGCGGLHQTRRYQSASGPQRHLGHPH